MTTKPIVVGTDGSAQAVRAIEWAAREAVLRGAPLRIVSAAEMPARMSAPPPGSGVETVATRLVADRDAALAAGASAAAAAAPGVAIETRPLDGSPAQALIGSGADALMVVVGSDGGGAFAAMALGSVSRYAAVHAPCPVVVIREEPARHRPPGRRRHPQPRGLRSGDRVRLRGGSPAEGIPAGGARLAVPRFRAAEQARGRSTLAERLPGQVPDVSATARSCTDTRGGCWPTCRPGPTWWSWAGTTAMAGWCRARPGSSMRW